MYLIKTFKVLFNSNLKTIVKPKYVCLDSGHNFYNTTCNLRCVDMLLGCSYSM